jgi:hypothetical protein
VANPPLHLIAAFNRHFPQATAQWVIQAPTHDAWIAAATGEPDGYTYALACAERPGRALFTRQSARARQTVLRRPLPDWARYPAGVILDLGAAGLDVPSIRAVVLGEETTSPRYEYGLGVAVAALWHTICAQPYTADTLREIVDRVRREYIG